MPLKQEVSEFYNSVGWQEVSDGVYQNARYEDLRPVSREYIHKCHLRINRHLTPQGKYLLDAGSGPIQYPEYLTYSESYQYRVCADISIGGLQEARKRIGEKGLFVVCDIAHLPFKPDAFEGVVSLHTIHHLPLDEHNRAYDELYRVLAPGNAAVIVNGWSTAPLVRLSEWMIHSYRKLRGGDQPAEKVSQPPPQDGNDLPSGDKPAGTFVKKHDAQWFQAEIAPRISSEIRVWRTFSVAFLRTFVHTRFGGRALLKVLYWFEERLPHWLGKNGQYPIIVFRKRA